jgi:hypothetical protein
LFSEGQVFALHFAMVRLRTGGSWSIVTTNEKGPNVGWAVGPRRIRMSLGDSIVARSGQQGKLGLGTCGDMWLSLAWMWIFDHRPVVPAAVEWRMRGFAPARLN